ncbi:MAG: hypothetical protein HN872_11620 [Gammaproteobacteria bacterium]|nr:hypothetical protein [Gammaproteobacteria bacterium]
MAGFYYFTFIDESILWRTRIYTLMMAIFSASIVYVLARGLRIERKLRPVMAMNTNFGAYLLLTLSLFNAIGDPILTLFRAGQPITSLEQATTILLLGGLVTVTTFALSVIIMTMEEVAVEYQENAIYDPITTILNHRTFIEVSNRVLGVALHQARFDADSRAC